VFGLGGTNQERAIAFAQYKENTNGGQHGDSQSKISYTACI